MGWDKTVARLSDDAVDLSEFEEALRVALVEHYWCGEKLLRIYRPDANDVTRLRQSLLDAKIPESDFRASYPALLSEEDLAGQPLAPTLVDVDESADGLMAVFASVRVVSVKEEVDREGFSQAVSDELSGFDEVIGIKHVRLQTMDVVSIPVDNSRVEVRVDFPRSLNQDSGEATHAQIRRELSDISGFDCLYSPLNLFPLINNIYSAAGEGVVVELAFGTTTASLKHEKMRRQHADLREETYHKAGKKALATDIEPHRLSVVWKRQIGDARYSLPELTLHTTTREVASRLPLLFQGELRNCIGVDDFDFVRQRMLKYLTP